MDKDLSALFAMHDKKLKWYRLLSFLMCSTIFITTYALIVPATTMDADKAAVCGYVSHAHTDKCRDAEGNLICGLPEHEHDMGCFRTPKRVSPYVCGYDYEHTHDAACYSDGVLTCTAVEHVHTDECGSAAEKLRIRISGVGTEILSALDRSEPEKAYLAVHELSAFYGMLDSARYEEGTITEDEYEALGMLVAEMIHETGALEKAAARTVRMLSPSTLPGPSDPVSFSGTYDTAANRKNEWQIVSGREGSTAYKVIRNGSNDPILRLKKTVLPAGKEDEFYISLVIEPTFTRNWERLFENADLIINNSHSTATLPPFHKTDGGVKHVMNDILGITNHGCYFQKAGDTVTSYNTTQPAKTTYPIKTIVVHVSSTESRSFSVDLQFTLGTISGLSFFYSTGTNTYKSKQFSYSSSTKTIDIPDETYSDMLTHGFDFLKYMDPVSTVSFSGASGTGMMTDGTTVRTITDYLGDRIELLEVLSYSGDPVKSDVVEINETDNSIDWTLEGAEPYRFIDTSKPTTDPAYYGYEELDVSAVDGKEYYARINAYQMIYKVRLDNDTFGFVSSVSGSALPAAADTVSAAKYQTNDSGTDLTTIVYELTGMPGVVYSQTFPSPVVRGALYRIELQKKDDTSSDPLPGAVFRLTTADNTPVFVSGTDGSYSYDPSATGNTVITGTGGGISVTGLPDGSYVLTEIDPPDGYKLSGTGTASYLLSYTENASALTADGTVFRLSSTPVILNKKLPKYTFTLLKQDDSPTPVPLKDAVFGIYQGTTLIDTLTTDTSGNAAMSSGKTLYADQTYVLRELAAPDGYYPAKDDLTFALDAETGLITASTSDDDSFLSRSYDSGTQTFSVTAVNVKGEVLPSTGGSGAAPYTVAGLCISGLSVWFLWLGNGKRRIC